MGGLQERRGQASAPNAPDLVDAPQAERKRTILANCSPYRHLVALLQRLPFLAGGGEGCQPNVQATIVALADTPVVALD